VNSRVKTKGRFPIQVRTNAGNWVEDTVWKGKANPVIQAYERRIEQKDNEVLLKKKK